MSGVHTCSYECERPECIRAQRDELAARLTAETSNARGGLRAGIDRLWDSQWVNIVNSPEVLNAIRNRDYEVAVGVAIRMTEKKMAENFAAALSQQPEPRGVVGARRLAVGLWQRHYREVAPEWEPCPDLAGLLSQIDNMVSGLTRAPALAQQPADVGEAMELVRDIAGQRPEKPDYWSSCGQCESNIGRAQEVLEAFVADQQQEPKS